MRKMLAGLLLGLAVMPAMAQEAVKSVVVPTEVAFTNKDVIDSAIVAECNLPQKTAELLMQALTKAGIEGKAVAGPKPDSGDDVLLVEIAAAQAGGNAFIGHFKSVTVTGKLFRKGQQVASFVVSRKSSGGAFAGFKGSCSVLGRCVDTIATDIARWLGSPVDGAKLGDAR